jgi:hypothetical protein
LNFMSTASRALVAREVMLASVCTLSSGWGEANRRECGAGVQACKGGLQMLPCSSRFLLVVGGRNGAAYSSRSSHAADACLVCDRFCPDASPCFGNAVVCSCPV